MQGRQDVALQRVIFGTRTVSPESGGELEECKVHHVTASGVYFTRPFFDNNRNLFGPAPYIMGATSSAGNPAHTHNDPQPPPGYRCLIAWVGAGVGNPWCLGWWHP